MKITGISLASHVTDGIVITLNHGQEYRLVRTEPYTNRNGETIQMLVWATICPETGIEFETKTTNTFHGFVRRAPGHRNPSRRIALKAVS